MSIEDPTVDVILLSADGVGESLQWVAEERALYWVDITGCRIKRFEPDGGRYDEWRTPGRPAAIVPRRGGGAVVALGASVTLFDFSDRFETLCVPEPDLPGNRLNEAAADPAGRLWVGSMQDNIAPDGSPRAIEGRKGSLWIVEADGALRRAGDERYGITNTMVWRDRVFITADTLAGELYAFDYDRDLGTISNRRIYSAEPGNPDGSCLDDEGYLWNARFGAGCLMRFSPTGRLDRVVRLPVANPTSCCFGGDGLRTLFVASARYGLDAAAIARNPREGSLMAVDVGVSGAPTWRFAG